MAVSAIVADVSYVGKVAKNIAMRYFGEMLAAVSVWGPITHADEYDPEFDTVNVAIVLSEVPEDILILQSSVEYDVRRALGGRVSVSLYDLSVLRHRYRRGFLHEVLIVEDAYYSFGEKIFEELAGEGYVCSNEAVEYSLESSLISLGMGLNNVLRGDIELLIEDIYSAVMMASVSVIQKKLKKPVWGARRVMRALRRCDILLSEIVGLCLRFLKSARRSLVTLPRSLGDHALGKLQAYLSVDPTHSLMVYAYEAVRLSWEIVKSRRISSIDTLVKTLCGLLGETYEAGIEIRGKGEWPVVFIKTPIEIHAVELR